MLKVFVCEDNKEQRERFTKIIKDIIMIENIDMEMALDTESPERLIEYIKESRISGLYFLDIDLKASINGINLASEIRKYDPRGFIVFVTTHAEMSYLTFTYKVEAMDYIIKDNYNNIKERIHQCILDANTKHSVQDAERQKIFSIKTEDKVVNIEFSKILFFETSPTIHKIIVHAIDRQLEFYAKMKEIEDKLDERFYRCHKSYLVNKDNIREIDTANRCAYMINGEQCLISTRLLKGLLD
jgi:two-component system response regulator AgrA